MKKKIFFILCIISFLLFNSCGKSIHKSENWLIKINSLEFTSPGLTSFETKDISNAPLALNVDITYTGPKGNVVMPAMYLLKDELKITSEACLVNWKKGIETLTPKPQKRPKDVDLIFSITNGDNNAYPLKQGQKITKYETIVYFPITRKDDLSKILVIFGDIPPFSIK